jgi:hypothetical protein
MVTSKAVYDRKRLASLGNLVEKGIKYISITRNITSVRRTVTRNVTL